MPCAVAHEVLDRPRERRAHEADHRQVLAALAGRLPRRVLPIRREPLVPAYEAKRAVRGERAVHERELSRARRLGQHDPAVGVVEAVDGELAPGEQLRRVARGEPHPERLAPRAVEVRELQPRRPPPLGRC